MTLAQSLIEAGLIQFGWFRRANELLPFDLHLEMLVSYPDLLEQTARATHSLIGEINVNRLLSTIDSMPFAVAFSLQSKIPLVYGHSMIENPVFDLIGAYDIGHPTLLLTNTLGWNESPTHLLHSARQVGLEAHTLLTILQARPVPPLEGFTLLPLLRLTDIVREMNASGRLTNGHAQAVQDWIESGETGT